MLLRWAAFLVVGWFGLIGCTTFVARTFAADILFPIVEPRLPIFVRADQGTKTMRGAYEVYELTGNCRIEQGSFSAQGRVMQLWIDHFVDNAEETSSDSEPGNDRARWMYKAIIRVDGEVKAEWLDEQRLEDETWMGRLYSHRRPKIDVAKLDQLTQPPLAASSKNANQISPLAPSSGRGGGGEGSFETSNPRTTSTPVQQAAFIADNSRVEPAQFEQLPSGQAPFNIPPPEEIRPQEIPAPLQSNTREGSLIDPSSSNPLGGMVLDGDYADNLPLKETTSLQPPTDAINQFVPPVHRELRRKDLLIQPSRPASVLKASSSVAAAESIRSYKPSHGPNEATPSSPFPGASDSSSPVRR